MVTAVNTSNLSYFPENDSLFYHSHNGQCPIQLIYLSRLNMDDIEAFLSDGKSKIQLSTILNRGHAVA
jgi:hypothetical protein